MGYRIGVDLGGTNMAAGVLDQPLNHEEVIETSNNVKKDFIALIKEIIKERQVNKIVSGLPKNMNGTEGPRAELCREFAAQVEEATGLPVKLWDERRTTVEAHNILSAHNYHGKKRKNTVDAVAASLILEGYLNFKKRN